MGAPDLDHPAPGASFARFTVERTYMAPSRRGTRDEKTCDCVCICGQRRTILASHLKNGNSKSCGCIQRKPPGESGFNTLIYRYQKKARERRLPFELSADEFRSLVILPCNYCGVPPSQQVFGTLGRNRNRAAFTYNGVDRVDNSVGYTVANCVPCCGACNMAKRNMPTGAFLQWLQRLFRHLTEKGAL